MQGKTHGFLLYKLLGLLFAYIIFVVRQYSKPLTVATGTLLFPLIMYLWMPYALWFILFSAIVGFFVGMMIAFGNGSFNGYPGFGGRTWKSPASRRGRYGGGYRGGGGIPGGGGFSGGGGSFGGGGASGGW